YAKGLRGIVRLRSDQKCQAELLREAGKDTVSHLEGGRQIVGAPSSSSAGSFTGFALVMQPAANRPPRTKAATTAKLVRPGSRPPGDSPDPATAPRRRGIVKNPKAARLCCGAVPSAKIPPGHSILPRTSRKTCHPATPSPPTAKGRANRHRTRPRRSPRRR